MSRTARSLIAVLCMALCFFTASCSEHAPAGVAAPAAANKLEGQDKKAVESQLRSAGFTNVKTQPIPDLITGWLKKDGQVEHVSIGGNTSFSNGDRFAADAEVIITYHTFPSPSAEPPKSTAATSTAAEPPKPTSASTSAPASPTSAPTPPPTTTAPPADSTITAANNQDFAELLQVTSSSDPKIAAFASKYSGRRIEFDAWICAMNKHGSAATRYDLLLCAGDFDPNRGAGPNFQYRDVNLTSDLHYAGDVPDTLKVGTQVHLISQVDQFDALRELLYLQPVETRFR